MRIVPIILLVIVLNLGVHCSGVAAAESPPITDTSVGDTMVAEYFEQQTAKLTDDALADIKTLKDWTSRRDEYRRQLLEMLGLDPFPERTPLQPVVTGRVPSDGFVVERLQFQSMPGLYVTANLYRPTSQDGPLPAVIYGCGHARVKEDGISLGNKTHYQHHGAWFARNGYVCLVLDTIQLGEIEGEHHGTYSKGRWWWNSRGYTPAGVEAWNCMRGIDYLASREEVDAERIGMTGRSGGGAYSWWTAAIDERVKVVVPVAGITSLKNHVVDGCVEGHCDCMYMVNTYQWDFPMVAALVAPRPLLISNTDKDNIFPLDGVIDVHNKVRRIYDLYGAAGHLGLNITEGPHSDTQELRVSAFHWLNRFLKSDQSLLTTQATSFVDNRALRVLEEIPADERVTTIDESFVPAVSSEQIPATRAEFEILKSDWLTALREKVFHAWPGEQLAESLDSKTVFKADHDDRVIQIIEFTSQSPYRLPIYLVSPMVPRRDAAVSVVVLDQSAWERLAAGLATAIPDQFPNAFPDETAWQEISNRSASSLVAYIVPRGVGLTEWTRDTKERTQIRRRFMLLGQTQATMQIYDVRRALQSLKVNETTKGLEHDLFANGDAAMWTLFASLFESNIRQIELSNLPVSNRDTPDLLNVSRFVAMPHVALLAADRVERLTIIDVTSQSNSWRQILEQSDVTETIEVRDHKETPSQ